MELRPASDVSHHEFPVLWSSVVQEHPFGYVGVSLHEREQSSPYHRGDVNMQKDSSGQWLLTRLDTWELHPTTDRSEYAGHEYDAGAALNTAFPASGAVNCLGCISHRHVREQAFLNQRGSECWHATSHIGCTVQNCNSPSNLSTRHEPSGDGSLIYEWHSPAATPDPSTWLGSNQWGYESNLRDASTIGQPLLKRRDPSRSPEGGTLADAHAQSSLTWSPKWTARNEDSWSTADEAEEEASGLLVSQSGLRTRNCASVDSSRSDEVKKQSMPPAQLIHLRKEGCPDDEKPMVPSAGGRTDSSWLEANAQAPSNCMGLALPHSEETAATTRPSGRRAIVHRKRSSSERTMTSRPARGNDHMNDFLVRSKLAGMSYRQIKDKGKFPEAESTLRGRFRTLTKHREQRVRKPEWQEIDVQLLQEAVQAHSSISRACASSHDVQVLGSHGRNRAMPVKLSWKKVAEYIWNNGGSYRFGNATCRKKWDEIGRGRRCFHEEGDNIEPA